MISSIRNIFVASPSWELPGQGVANYEEAVFRGFLSAVFFLLGMVAVGFIIYAGIRLQLSRGNAGKMVEARTMLIYSVIGLVVAASAFAIINFVRGELGRDL
jgi:ABC-type Fe3+ transport system permease subunit